MKPIEPIEPVPAENLIESVPADDSATSGQLSEDENYAADLVDIGRRTADTETRDAVTQRYVDEANAGDDTEEALADLARSEAGEDYAEEVGPETDAIHAEVPPED